MNTSVRFIGDTGVTLLAVAWLLPVGDAPWFSFWREWMAAAAVLLILLGAVSSLRDLGPPLRWRAASLPTVAIGFAGLCWAQYAGGLVPSLADALIPSLYLSGFALCAWVAGSLPPDARDALADRLASAMLGAALLSAPLAVLQWLGWATLDLGLRVAGGRPVAHMEQTNLLCSLAIQGSLAAWRLVERGRLGRGLGGVMLLPLLLTMALTQSRVAWLVAAAVMGVVAWRRDLMSWRRSGRVAVVVAIAVVLGSLLVPWLNSHTGQTGATLADRTSEGRRPAVWGLFIGAIRLHPWAGWGALQNGAAQYAVADRHPALAWYFSSAHDLPLDLMVWFGVPMGLLASAALLWTVARRIGQAPDAPTLATAVAAAALVLHALVELPLHYAYFLLPLGLLLGMAPGRAPEPASATLRLSAGAPGLLPALTLIPALLLALLARDYISLGDARPVLAVDKTTQHVMLLAEQAPPEVMLIDQLRAFHAFAAIPLQPGATAAQLAASRAAMLRTPYAPAIERHALLAGLNGREAEAREALMRLCKFEPPIGCEESERVWQLWREQWPQLPPWPAVPPKPRP